VNAEQPTLDFDTRRELMAPPAQSHSRTSQAAAEQIQPNAGTLRAEVLEHLRKSGPHGATDEEMQTALGMNPSTQRPRRIELVRAGLASDSGTTRPTISGRQATVWKATTNT
jgi:hypothetical protein